MLTTTFNKTYKYLTFKSNSTKISNFLNLVIFMVLAQVRNEGGARGAQFPGFRITAGSLKSPNNVASTFFNTVHLLPKDLRFENFLLAPGLAPSDLVTPLY